jgi:tRNA-Thr(GGU) m(6)t(6)A37 methyltransferase TsaA
MNAEQLQCRPIGTIRTAYSSKYAAPRQPGTSSRRTVGTITLEPGHNFEQALQDLKGFGYIWVLFWFHENRNWKPMVLPPVGDRKKRGVFATRSPHRPNPIGLSLCKLLSIKGRTVRIENPDMLDGTPILDIKPYIPHAESKPRAKDGWISMSHERTKAAYRVVFASSISAVLRKLPVEERSTLRTYLRTTLSRDPHPHAYRRIKEQSDGSWVIAVQRWRFGYSVKASTVHVVSAWSVGTG